MAGETFSISPGNAGKRIMLKIILCQENLLSPSKVDDCVRGFGYHKYSDTGVQFYVLTGWENVVSVLTVAFRWPQLPSAAPKLWEALADARRQTQ